MATKTVPDVMIVPANEASWEDLQAVFSTRGVPAQCQHYKIRDMDWRSVPVEERADRLREQTDCGHPESDTTSGLVAYHDEPVGWCAVEPRTAYPRLLRTRVPWSGRAEDKTDDGVWAMTCLSPALGSGAAESAERWPAPRSTSPGDAAPVRTRATR